MALKRISIDQVALVANAARIAGIADQTFRDAIQRGEVPCYEMADGTRVVRIEDAKNLSTRKRGRPRGAK